MEKEERILLTGSSGFLGTALGTSLREDGMEVYGVDRDSGVQGLSRVLDLKNRDAVVESIRQLPRITTVIHLAALAHGQRPDPLESCISVNVGITENLLLAFQGQNPHWIFFSSVAVYGEDDQRESLSTLDETHPSTDYGLSKKICEERLLSSAFTNCDVLRLSPVFDEQHLKDVGKRVFLPGTSIRLRLLPPPRHSLCCVATVIEAVKYIVKRGGFGRNLYQLSDSKTYSQAELLQWFSGPILPIPVALTSPLFWLLRLIPGRKGSLLRSHYRKLFCTRLYRTALFDKQDAPVAGEATKL